METYVFSTNIFKVCIRANLFLSKKKKRAKFIGDHICHFVWSLAQMACCLFCFFFIWMFIYLFNVDKYNFNEKDNCESTLMNGQRQRNTYYSATCNKLLVENTIKVKMSLQNSKTYHAPDCDSHQS